MKAIKYFEKALQLDPYNGFAYFNLAQVYELLGDIPPWVFIKELLSTYYRPEMSEKSKLALRVTEIVSQPGFKKRNQKSPQYEGFFFCRSDSVKQTGSSKIIRLAAKEIAATLCFRF